MLQKSWKYLPGKPTAQAEIPTRPLFRAQEWHLKIVQLTDTSRKISVA